MVFSSTSQLGIYAVQWKDSLPSRFAVNLFSPVESNVQPLDNLTGIESQTEANATGAQPGQQEWWRWLAGAALILLISEWLVYQRAAVRRLLDAAARRFKRSAPTRELLRKE